MQKVTLALSVLALNGMAACSPADQTTPGRSSAAVSGRPDAGSLQVPAAQPGSMVTSPTTGSQQGINTHNSQPMPRGMVMPANPGTQGPILGSSPNTLPPNGNQAGVEPPGSMPPGHMAADPNKRP